MRATARFYLSPLARGEEKPRRPQTSERCLLRRWCLGHDAAEAHQRVGAERLHTPALNQLDAAVILCPGHEPAEREFRPQAERARRPRSEALDDGQHAALRIEMVDQNDLAARPQHARAFGQNASGLAASVMTNWATTQSNEASSNASSCASITRTSLTCG